MKKILTLAVLIISAPLFSQTAPLPIHDCIQEGVQAKTSGLLSSNYLLGIVPYCLVTVYDTGTQVIATTTPQTPLTVRSNGSIPPIYAATGQGYDVVLSNSSQTVCPNCYTTPVTITDVFAGGGSGGGGSISGPVGAPTAISGSFPGTGTTLMAGAGYVTIPGLVYGNCAVMSAANMTANTTALNTALAAGYKVGIGNSGLTGGDLCVNGVVTCKAVGCGLVGYGLARNSPGYSSNLHQTADTDGVVVGIPGSGPVTEFVLRDVAIIGPGSGSGTRVGLHLTNGVGTSGGGAGFIENVNTSGFSQGYVNNYFDQMTVINTSFGSDATNSGLPTCQTTGTTSDDSSLYLRWGCSSLGGSPTAGYEIDGSGRGARYFFDDTVDTGASPSIALIYVTGNSKATYYLGDSEQLTAPKMVIAGTSEAIVFNSGNQGQSLNTTAPLFEITGGAILEYHGIAEASATATNSPAFTLSTGFGAGNSLPDSTQECYVLPGYNSSGHTAYPEQCITTGSGGGNNNYVTLTITQLPGITTMVPGRGATGAEQLFGTISLAGNATTWTDTGALTPAVALPGAATLKYPEFYTDSTSNLIANVVTPGNGATTMQGMWAKSNGQIDPALGRVLSYPYQVNAADGSAEQSYERKFALAASASTNTQLVTVTTNVGNPGNEISEEVTLTAQGPVIGQTVTTYLCVGYASVGVTCYETATTETPASQKLSISTATAGTNAYTFYVFNTDAGNGRTGTIKIANHNYGGATIQSVTIGTAANGTPTAAGWAAFGNTIAAAQLPNVVPQVGTPTAGYAACIKAAGPPVVIGYCSTVVGSGGTCTCN